MKRLILGTLLGFLVWSVLWLVANNVLFADAAASAAAGDAITDVGTLLSILAASVVCSLAGGITSAKLGRDRARGAVIANGGLLLIVGILVQLSVWSTMPVWYHLSFLALLIPATIVGGRFVPAPQAV
jgi:hypothetical protein